MEEQKTEDCDMASPEYMREMIGGPKKIPLVLFSGGLDSTYTLFRELMDSDVDVMYVAGGQGPHKINAELRACEDILEQLKGLPNLHKVRSVYFVGIEIDAKKDSASHDYFANQNFAQPTQWISGAIGVAHPSRHNRVVVSYVSGDQMLANLQNFEYVWNYLCCIIYGGYATIPVAFPSKSMRKRNMIEELPLGILTKTWTCELPRLETGTRVATTDGIRHAIVPSLADGKSDRSYSYVACGECEACLSQKESFVTTKYGPWEKFQGLVKAAKNPGEFVKIESENKTDSQ